MSEIVTAENRIRDPLAWADDCRAQADFDIEPEARSAFAQLAEEFEALSVEFDALVEGYESLVRRKRPMKAAAPLDRVP
jgi:hypothetical protein